MADNVRSYLTLSRYLTREDLTDAQVRRLADRAVDEAADALRPFGYYAPNIRSRTSRDDPKWIVRIKIGPGEPVRLQDVDVEILGAGATDEELTRCAAETTVKPGARLDHASYEALKASLMRTARDRGYLDATLTRRELIVNPTDLTADARITLETGGRYEFGASRDRTGRDRRRPAAGLPALRAGPAVFARAAERHAVRARGQQLLLDRRGHARRARPRDPDRADPHPRRADQAQSLRRQRRLRHRYRRPRPVRLGQPPGQYAGPSFARGADRLRGALRGAGALRDPGRRSEPREARVPARLHRRGNRRPQEPAHRTDRRPDAGLRTLAAGDVPEAQRRTHDVPGRQRGQPCC